MDDSYSSDDSYFCNCHSFEECAESDSQSSSHDSYYYDSDGSNQYSYTIGNKRYNKKAFKRVIYSDDSEKIKAMFVDCIKEDKFEPLESLLCRCNFKINDVLVEEKSQTALHLAYYYNNESLVELLSEYRPGDQVNATDCNGLTHLHVATWANNEDLIKKCLEDGADINACYTDADSKGNAISGITPLYLASSHSAETVKLLLDNGADVNACYTDTDSKGNAISGITPLYLASSHSAETVKLLLDNGADVNATTSSGRSALHVACYSYGYPHSGENPEQVYATVEIMKLLMDHRCDVNKRDTNGNTPLLCIYRESYFTARGLWPKIIPMAESIEKLKLLLERGADVTITNNDGDTVLHRMIRIILCFNYVEPEIHRLYFDSAKHAQMAEIILNAGNVEIVNARNELGETPLQLAVSLMSANIVKVLLDHGADMSCLTFNQNEEYCFCYPNEIPKHAQVWNVVNIMEILLDRGFVLTLNENLMIMKFLTHNIKKCECSNVSGIEELDSILESWFTDSFKNDSTQSHLKNLMAFGSPSHFENVLTEIIEPLSARNLTDEKTETLHFVKQLFDYKKKARLFIEKKIKKLVKKLKIKYEISSKWLERIKLEISYMKRKELVDGISVYSVMVKHPHDIYQYVKNVYVPDLKLGGIFCIYDSLIEGHITKSLIRHYVEKSAHDYVIELSAFTSLPELCTRRIMYYLNNEEILNVCLAAVSDD